MGSCMTKLRIGNTRVNRSTTTVHRDLITHNVQTTNHNVHLHIADGKLQLLQQAGTSSLLTEVTPASVPPPQQQHGRPLQQPVELLNAWYGVDGNGFDNNGQVQAALRRNIAENGGRLVLNGSHHTLFGFDPLPNVHKVVAIHVRYQGQEHHLRAQDGAPFTFPDANNTSPVQQQRPNIEIINAWYGVVGNGSDNGGQVQEHLRRLLREHGHVRIPANQFGLYGFDPVYGVHKETGLHVRCNGVEHHLRVPEGQDFNWYGN